MNSSDFKAVMARYPTGVVVVTTVEQDGHPLGLTCSSLSAVSLCPPLLLICIANTSRTLAAIQHSRGFAVNMLHWNGRHAAQAFVGDPSKRFASVTWEPTAESRMPALIEDAHSVAECTVFGLTVAGDHTVVIGQVTSVTLRDLATPLIYGLQRYAAWPQDLEPSTR